VPTLVLADGGRLHHEECGPERGTIPLVLLEGLGGDIPGWRRFLDLVAADRRIVALDHRGNGRSDPPPPDATVAGFAADVLALLDHLGLERVHLYGMSMGGKVGIELALDHPDRLASLTLASTNAGRARASRVTPPTPVPKGRPYLSLYSEAFVRDDPDQVEADVRERAARPRSFASGRAQWRAMRSWDAWDRLPKIRVPTLVVHGTGDRLTAVENGRRMAAAIPGAELALFEGGGHVLHVERPDDLAETVLGFLARVEAGA
jgi:pimeloyl-ACP methyl ester carboxylesterase